MLRGSSSPGSRSLRVQSGASGCGKNTCEAGHLILEHRRPCSNFHLPSTRATHSLNMPSEHCMPQDVSHIEQTQQQTQVKLCSSCHYPLSPEPINLLHPEAAFVCAPCQERICAPRAYVEYPERQEDDAVPVEDFGLPLIDQDVHMDFRPATPPPASPFVTHPPVSTSFPVPIHHQHPQCSPPTSPSALPPSPSPHASTSLADPYADITRLRARSHSQDCLYPGAQFSGTQKSGRSSYEVSVTIVVRARSRHAADLPDSSLARMSTFRPRSFVVTFVSAASRTTGQSSPHTSTPRSLVLGTAFSPTIGVRAKRRT